MEAILDQINELVHKGEKREIDNLKSDLEASRKRIAELEAQVKAQETELANPSPETHRLVEQAMAAMKVHSARARNAITEGEGARRNVILLRREVEALKKELETVKAQKAEEAAIAQITPEADPESTKVRRSQRRLSPRFRTEGTGTE